MTNITDMHIGISTLYVSLVARHQVPFYHCITFTTASLHLFLVPYSNAAVVH